MGTHHDTYGERTAQESCAREADRVPQERGADGYRVWRPLGCNDWRPQFRTTEAAAHPSGATLESFPIRNAEDAAASMCDTPQARHSNV
jgi:hypothetical protein